MTRAATVAAESIAAGACSSRAPRAAAPCEPVRSAVCFLREEVLGIAVDRCGLALKRRGRAGLRLGIESTFAVGGRAVSGEIYNMAAVRAAALALAVLAI